MATITILGAFFIRPFPPEVYLINPFVIGGNIISSFLQLPFRAKKSFESSKASSNPELSLLSHYQHKCKKHLFPIHIYPLIAQKAWHANLEEKNCHSQFRRKQLTWPIKKKRNCTANLGINWDSPMLRCLSRNKRYVSRNTLKII